MRPKAQVGHMDLNKLAQIEENGSENLNIGLWCDLLVQWRLLYFVMNRIGTLSLSLSLSLSLNNRRIRIRYFMPPTYKLSPPTSKSQKTERFTYVREYNRKKNYKLLLQNDILDFKNTLLGFKLPNQIDPLCHLGR